MNINCVLSYAISEKFFKNKLLLSFLAIVLVIKLIKIKIFWILPLIVGVTAAKKLLLKFILFLFPALSHLFKLCSYYHKNYHDTKYHHHHHQINHLHTVWIRRLCEILKFNVLTFPVAFNRSFQHGTRTSTIITDTYPHPVTATAFLQYKAAKLFTRAHQKVTQPNTFTACRIHINIIQPIGSTPDPVLAQSMYCEFQFATKLVSDFFHCSLRSDTSAMYIGTAMRIHSSRNLTTVTR